LIFGEIFDTPLGHPWWCGLRINLIVTSTVLEADFKREGAKYCGFLKLGEFCNTNRFMGVNVGWE
jgi:hypothetical protein